MTDLVMGFALLLLSVIFLRAAYLTFLMLFSKKHREDAERFFREKTDE